jgi:hypothetical protein
MAGFTHKTREARNPFHNSVIPSSLIIVRIVSETDNGPLAGCDGDEGEEAG